jgi:para-nitrobenzyl esterase
MSRRTAAVAVAIAVAIANVVLLIGTIALPAPAGAFSLVPGENVRVSTGIVQGRVALDRREFFGIPFAAPPTGARRFAPPAPAASWSGERPARDHGPACPQSFPIIGTLVPSAEDCLYLDVYTPPATPQRTAAKKTPVMVWFYGGAYSLGSASQYDPAPLVTQGGVIVVQVNYRVGPFGFLALPALAGQGPAGAGGSAGNYGLLDQQAGLRWVRQNIGAFGGDASNVTIFGESAGGNSVCQQLASPGSAGLFQRAIVQSGGCGAVDLSGLPRQQAYANGLAYAKAAGCPDPATQVACLRAAPVSALLAPPGVQFTSMKLTFVPTVDGVTVPRLPVDAFAAGTYSQVPILLGGQRDEGRFFVALFHHFSTLSRVSAAQYASEVREVFGPSADRILAQYPASAYARISADSAIDLAQAQVWTDGLFACPMVDAVQALRKNPGQVLYGYEFADTKPPLSDGDPLMNLGAFHGSDLFYLFSKNSDIPVLYLDPAQRRLSQRMISYWTTFARTGNPNPAGNPNPGGGSAWPALAGPAPQLQTLSSAASTPFPLSSFSAGHQCDFWKSLT